MPDKITDNDIKKALECCSKPHGEGCNECPLHLTNCLNIDNGQLALDLINRLEAERDNLKESRDRWKQIAEDFDKASRNTEKEIEGLQAENERLKKGWKADILLTENTKAEAYKEFADRLKKEIIEAKYQYIDTPYARACNQVADWCVNLCDNIFKEMVGEDNA